MLAIVFLMAPGCSDKKDEVEALEQEAQEPEAGAVLDSLQKGAGQEMAVDTMETMAEPTQVAETPDEPPQRMPDYSQQSGYVVQIGSYVDVDFAEMIAEKYRNREYPAFVSDADIDGELLYRVRIGVYDSFDEAKSIGEELKDRFSAEYWVDMNP
jgi:cell division septation protein DedD